MPSTTINGVILIPWRASDHFRERNLAFVKAWYAPLGWPIVLADSGHQPFNRAASRNAAAEQAGRQWDAAVFIDADNVTSHAAVTGALARAVSAQRVILPHDTFFDLDPSETDALVEQARQSDIVRHVEAKWGHLCSGLAPAPSGTVVMSRRTFEALDGYDEAFVGWGHEDAAMLVAADRLLGECERLPGFMLHLWHPTATASGDSSANAERFARYARTTTASEMRELIAARKLSRRGDVVP